MSVRKAFEQAVCADWASIPELTGLRVVATERALDNVTQSTALIRLRSVAKAPSAPISHRHVLLWLTIISAHEDIDRAADELEDLTAAALDYLDTRVMHDDAEVAEYGDRLAMNIPLTVLASKE